VCVVDWRDPSQFEDTSRPDAQYPERFRHKFIAQAATDIELQGLAVQAWRRAPQLGPPALEHAGTERVADTGRRELTPDPALLWFGRNVRRGRRIVGMSQQQVADRCGSSQSTLSRLERGLAPSLGIDRLVRLTAVLGRALPLGECPHEHHCPWREIVLPRPSPSAAEAFAALVLGQADESADTTDRHDND